MLDSGAAVHAAGNRQFEVAGTRVKNTTAVSTARGTYVPPYKCKQLLPMRSTEGQTYGLPLPDSIILDDCDHILVSPGKLGRDMRASFWMAPPGELSYLSLPQTSPKPAVKFPLLVRGVSFIPNPLSAAQSKAVADLLNSSQSVPSSHPDALMAQHVVRGNHPPRRMEASNIHRYFNHRDPEVLRHLPECTEDAPDEWRNLHVLPGPCHDCLRASCKRISSAHQSPVVAAAGDLVSMDMWYCSVDAVGGGRLVLGFHDRYSSLDQVYLCKAYDDACEAIEQFFTWCDTKGVTVKWIHTDNAPNLCKGRAAAFFRKRGVRLTTCAQYEPRGNGVMERRWGVIGVDTLKNLTASKLGPKWWWYAMRDAVQKNWCIPSSKNHSTCPWLLFTGKKPKCMYHRPFGCTAYFRDHHPDHKMAPQGRRCAYLGRAPNQSAYLGVEIDTGKLLVATHVYFCPDVMLGTKRDLSPEQREQLANEVSQVEWATANSNGSAPIHDPPPPDALDNTLHPGGT
jgi:hypothetical protein